MKNIAQSFKIIAIAVILSLGISYVSAWTAPSQAPTDGNVDAPINTGTITQYRDGALGIGGLLRGYGDAIFDGNVGIGTIAPTQKLDVEGYVKGRTGLCIGNDCKTSWPSGGGISSCPSGWTMIGDAGKKATYCIETNQRAAANYFISKNTCNNINDPSLGRARLCTHNEWYAACILGTGLSNMTNDWERTADLADATYVILAGHVTYGGCSALNSNASVGNSPYPYRCCL